MPDGAFDVVTCVFGLSFAADMDAAIAALVQALRPGGTLADVIYARTRRPA